MKLKRGMKSWWADAVAKNSDPYGAATVRFAKEWAELMEKKLARPGAKLERIARKAATEVDRRPGMGVTGFMYGCAVQMLAHVWVHGERLRQWHNLDTQLRDEGERANKTKGVVLNPAILSFDAEPK